ncbi:hypothetical protein [Caulobacter mirabilis]|uniref:Secreted protein n=1 Tax=Caulobacter mirabilis TaxID=69666 RepID=A0A2D2AVQ8_9CAUL|nr:hypothetical protein [Caulobacter mirabilis]ATQ42102.1 hypothetical protein CSW64_06570 [Caulobacter mirabilis]
MRTFFTAMIIAAAASSATVAVAAEARLSDTQFIKVAQCRTLPGADGEKFTALYKANKRGRADHVVDKADAAKRDAERGGADMAAKLAQECAVIVP